MIRLRDARPDDAAAIAAIWNPIIRETAITFWPVERSDVEIAGIVAERQRAGHAFLVAEQQGVVAGFATYSQFRAGLGYARSMEHSINLAPSLRGTGTGRQLMRAIEDHARARNYRLMIGGITASNTVSLLFHAHLGYAQWGRIPAAGWKFGAFHDLVLMGKDLGTGP